MMLDGISSIDGITVLGPASNVDRIGVVAFAVDGVHPTTSASSWIRWIVAVRVGHPLRDSAAHLLPGALLGARIGGTDDGA